MRKTKKAPSRAKKATARPKRKAARKAPPLNPAELAEIERTADILGAALAPAFAPAPAPQPLIWTAPSRWVPEGNVPQVSDKPVESAADLSCLHAYRSPGPIRAAFVREVIDVGPPSRGWNGRELDPCFVVFADGETLEFPQSMFARYMPQVGDAFVLYPDGHSAFLPRAEFNACYGRKPLGLWARIWRAIAGGVAL
jgi:hypothetical protein